MTNKWIHRILSFPLTRILLGMAGMFIPLLLVNNVLLKPVLGLLPISEEIARVIRFAILTPLFMYAYIWYFGKVEKRKITEWTWNGMFRESTVGFLVAFTALSIPVLILIAIDSYEISLVNIPFYRLLYPLAILFFLAFTEEIFFRGIVYRILEESLGTPFALILSASLFTVMHLTNDFTTVWSTLSVFIGGILLGACFRISGRLWLPSFAHLGWNFAQIFWGLNVSGLDKFGEYSPLVATGYGSDLMTGGGFGPESSIITILSNTLISAFLIIYLYRMDRIIKPFWNREA
jgi:uncharacterized protein